MAGSDCDATACCFRRSPPRLIGAFEGAYNHVLKNVLYFGGASTDLLARLFPAPRYELPNDVIFEVAGIMQVVPAAFAARHVVEVVRNLWRARGIK